MSTGKMVAINGKDKISVFSNSEWWAFTVNTTNAKQQVVVVSRVNGESETLSWKAWKEWLRTLDNRMVGRAVVLVETPGPAPVPTASVDENT